MRKERLPKQAQDMKTEKESQRKTKTLEGKMISRKAFSEQAMIGKHCTGGTVAKSRQMEITDQNSAQNKETREIMTMIDGLVHIAQWIVGNANKPKPIPILYAQSLQPSNFFGLYYL